LLCYASAKSFRTLCDTVCQNNVLEHVFTRENQLQANYFNLNFVLPVLMKAATNY
jgi:hypothetical protein